MKLKPIVITVTTLLLYYNSALQTFGQMPCNYPSGEFSDASGPNPNQPLATMFNMRLQLGSGEFNGWTVFEETASQGADSCWSPQANPALVPEYPGTTGGTWTVNNDIHWGPDNVGWLTSSVNYIRQNSGLYSNTPIITTFPCGAQINQAMFIRCPLVSTPYAYIPSQALTATIYQYYTFNCRAGTCEQENY